MLRPQHPIFAQPFAVTLQLEDTRSPDNFAKWSPGFPDTVPTFAIFEPPTPEGEPGLVTSDAGFEDTPDAERILGGINMKGPQYAAVARHGSFVMWGFHTRPERLTGTGRRLYLNTLAYAAAHKGALVETLRLRPTRVDLEHALTIFLALYPEGQRQSMLERNFTGEPLPPQFATDAYLRRRWFNERRPYLHPADDGSNWQTASQLTVDTQCRELGEANDSLTFLDALRRRLEADVADTLAVALLARYVPDVAAADFAAWLTTNREQLYFTEAGGWVWRRKGQPAASPVLSAIDPAAADPLVTVKAETTATTLTIVLRIHKGWHAWSPKATEQSPVQIAILDGSSFAVAGEPHFDADEQGMLTGYTEIKVPIRRVGAGDALHVAVTYTVCDEKSCRPPRTVELQR